MKEKKKLDKICIGLYVVAAIFGVYTIFTIINTSLYISDLVTIQGLDIGSNISNIVSYFMTACAPYLFYTIVLGVMGYEISKMHHSFDDGKDAIETKDNVAMELEKADEMVSTDLNESEDKSTAEVVSEEAKKIEEVEVSEEIEEVGDNKEEV
ncbi:MAG: hypothetical protein RSD63_02255 [Eubacterium sp.]